MTDWNWQLWVIFCPPPLIKTKKVRILKKWKKLLEISSFYTSVPKTTIIWGTVPAEWDRVFCHFGPFFAILPLLQPENQNLKKMKKAFGDVIILHMCTKNHNHTMYAFWDMKYDRHNFSPYFTLLPHYCPIFYPFTPLLPPKIKIWKKCKKKLDIFSY